MVKKILKEIKDFFLVRDVSNDMGGAYFMGVIRYGFILWFIMMIVDAWLNNWQ